MKKNKKQIMKSIEIGMIDKDNEARELILPMTAIDSFHISGIKSVVGYFNGESDEYEEGLTFEEFVLKIYKSYKIEKEVLNALFNNPFIISLIIVLDNGDTKFFDVPYPIACQKIWEDDNLIYLLLSSQTN